jgi:SNF2 family DNA or RNA helicase
MVKASKYGSKIQALLEHLRGLLQADMDNRIILFVQWEDLRKKVGSALTEFGVEHMTLEGNIWQRRDAIQQFQGSFDDEGANSQRTSVSKSSATRRDTTKGRNCKKSAAMEEPVRILLLSLEHSASGTNFTAANHVVLFHPMLAETPHAGAAFEMQAVGRALRYGQRRTVEVWRFVTADTVEQQITEQHSQELWQRFRAQRVVGCAAAADR